MSRRSEDPLRHVIVRLPQDIHAQIKARAAHEDLSMAQAIRRAIRLYLADLPPIT